MDGRELTSYELAEIIVEGMQEKKAIEVVQLDMSKIPNRVVDFFVICHGSSSTQVEAISESVERLMKEKAGVKPRSVEGKQVGEWVLLDYFDVVAHIFLAPVRGFYKLEALWADADMITFER